MWGRTERRAHRALRFGMLIAAFAVALGCGTTTDSLGSRRRLSDASELDPLTGPASYPNAFRDVLGKTDVEIASKIETTFQLLFYGDPATEAIYYTVGEDQAYVFDVLHQDIRTEGMGLGMMVAVQLNKRQEFDRLWLYAKTALRHESPPNRGYFQSSCDTDSGSVPCIDPFGHQQLSMALLFAHGRWGSDSGRVDYASDARVVLDVMRTKEQENGGIVGGVTDLFDDGTKLPFHVPNVSSAGQTRTSVVLPAYYELWAQATGDRFWRDAAVAGREFWKRAAHPTTGLTPLRAHFDGAPVSGSDTFVPEGYRTHLNVALDQIWFDADGWEVDWANRLIGFFATQGATGTSYQLDGTVLDSAAEPSLVIANGVIAQSATVAPRGTFIQAVWDLETQPGAARYYTGILDLVALLMLGGQYRVY
jgi:oligosaccharide reducing-end xylanase